MTIIPQAMLQYRNDQSRGYDLKCLEKVDEKDQEILKFQLPFYARQLKEEFLLPKELILKIFHNLYLLWQRTLPSSSNEEIFSTLHPLFLKMGSFLPAASPVERILDGIDPKSFAQFMQETKLSLKTLYKNGLTIQDFENMMPYITAYRITIADVFTWGISKPLAIMKVIPKASHLQSLEIKFGTGFYQPFFRNLSSLEHLENLTIGGGEYLEAREVVNISLLGKLKNLYVDCSERFDTFNNDWFLALSHTTQLQSLQLSTNQCTFSLTPLAFLGKLTNLTHLNLSGMNVDDAQMSQLLTMKKLKTLDLSFNSENITDKGLIYLTALTCLEDLDLAYNNIQSICHLSPLSNLKTLNLTSNEELNLKSTLNFPNLKVLSLVNCNLDNTQVEYLTKLVTLKSLSLCYNQIDELRFLSRFSNLQVLHLEGPQFKKISTQYITRLANLRILALVENEQFAKKVFNYLIKTMPQLQKLIK